MFYQVATAALATPDGLVRDVIYPVASEQTLEAFVESYNDGGQTFRQLLHSRIVPPRVIIIGKCFLPYSKRLIFGSTTLNTNPSSKLCEVTP